MLVSRGEPQREAAVARSDVDRGGAVPGPQPGESSRIERLRAALPEDAHERHRDSRVIAVDSLGRPRRFLGQREHTRVGLVPADAGQGLEALGQCRCGHALREE